MATRRRTSGLTFSRRELRDLTAAWGVLGLAMTILLGLPRIRAVMSGGTVSLAPLGRIFLLSMVTVGLGFLLHELAHKIVAVRFGQVAAFRADYTMLLMALFFSLLGFLFAAPGAVYHQGRISRRENGLIAVAGPVTNLILAAIFLALFEMGVGFLVEIGAFGFFINVVLAAFNMIPFGPLDGRKVLDWSPPVFAGIFLPSLVLALSVLGIIDLPLPVSIV